MDNNNNNGYISRIIRGITNANSIRPTVTPDSILSFLTQNKDTYNISRNDDGNFNSNYDIDLNSSKSQNSLTNSRDSIPENFRFENEEFNNNKLKTRKEFSFRDTEDSEAGKAIIMSNKKTKSSILDISNQNISNNLARKLNINNPDINYKNNFKPEAYLSNNNKNINDLDRSLYSSKNTINNKLLQKNEILKKTSEPTITINIGKITVRYSGNNNSKNIKDMNNNVIRNSKKLSLSDYLKKRSAGDN
jgi:hypothetical protein